MATVTSSTRPNSAPLVVPSLLTVSVAGPCLPGHPQWLGTNLAGAALLGVSQNGQAVIVHPLVAQAVRAGLAGGGWRRWAGRPPRCWRPGRWPPGRQ